MLIISSWSPFWFFDVFWGFFISSFFGETCLGITFLKLYNPFVKVTPGPILSEDINSHMVHKIYICVIAKQNAHSRIVLRLKKFGMFELTTYHFVKGGQNTARNWHFLSNVALIEWSDHANRMRAHEGKSNQHNLLSAVMFCGQQRCLEIEQTLPF